MVKFSGISKPSQLVYAKSTNCCSGLPTGHQLSMHVLLVKGCVTGKQLEHHLGSCRLFASLIKNLKAWSSIDSGYNALLAQAIGSSYLPLTMENSILYVHQELTLVERGSRGSRHEWP